MRDQFKSFLRSVLFILISFMVYGALVGVLNHFISLQESLMITILFAIVQMHEDIYFNNKK